MQALTLILCLQLDSELEALMISHRQLKWVVHASLKMVMEGHSTMLNVVGIYVQM